jgi:hypothetical protein
MRIGVWRAIAGGGTAVAVVLDDEIMSSGMGARVFLESRPVQIRKEIRRTSELVGEPTHPPKSSGYLLPLRHRHHPNHLGLPVQVQVDVKCCLTGWRPMRLISTPTSNNPSNSRTVDPKSHSDLRC